MHKKGSILLLCVLMVFLLACNCNLLNMIKSAATGSDSDNSSGGGNSPFSLGDNNKPSNLKKFDGEITIVDQNMAMAGWGSQFAILIENSSEKLTISELTLVASIKDNSGNELPLLNLSDGESKEISYPIVIYPRQKSLICMNYELPEGSTVGDYSFSFKDIKSMDLGLENPLVVDSKDLIISTDPIINNYVGVVSGLVRNASTGDVLHPLYRAALYDASGKIIGCGFESETYTFIPAGATHKVEMKVWTADQNVDSYEVFTNPPPDTGIYYTGAEPIQVSDVGFIQEEVYVYPVYTLTNTLPDQEIIQYLVNLIAYDANNNFLKKSSFVTEGIPPGMSVGPYHDEMGQVGESVVARVEVQVHTTEVKKPNTKITADSVVFSQGVYVPGEYKITTTATNNTEAELYGFVQAACIDASGKVTGLAQGSFDLPPKSDTPLELSGGYVGYYETGPNCSPEDKIEFNFLKIYEW